MLASGATRVQRQTTANGRVDMTQKAQILDHLKQGKTITPMEALQEYGCFRLAAAIYDLRGEGYKIDTESVNWGNKTFARYQMRAEK